MRKNSIIKKCDIGNLTLFLKLIFRFFAMTFTHTYKKILLIEKKSRISLKTLM